MRAYDGGNAGGRRSRSRAGERCRCTGKPRALARAVSEVLSDRTGLRARGNLARKKAVERYSQSATVSALTSLYRMKTKEAT